MKKTKTQNGFDSRLVGTTAENLFFILLNQREIDAARFDTHSFDGIVFGHNKESKKFFKKGTPPFFVQIKYRGSKTKGYNNTGQNHEVIKNIKKTAKKWHINPKSLYLVLGFSRYNDIRMIEFFIIPFSELKEFKNGKKEYRFSVNACEKIAKNNKLVTRLPLPKENNNRNQDKF